MTASQYYAHFRYSTKRFTPLLRKSPCLQIPVHQYYTGASSNMFFASQDEASSIAQLKSAVSFSCCQTDGCKHRHEPCLGTGDMHLPRSYHSKYRSFTKPTWQRLGSHGPFLELSLGTTSWHLPVCSFQNANPAVSGSIIPVHPTQKCILRNQCSIVITITAFADGQSIRDAQPTPITTQRNSDQHPHKSAHKRATSDRQECRSPPSLPPQPCWGPWLQQQPPQPGMRPAKSRTDSLASNSLERKTQTRTRKDLTMSRW